MAQIDTATVRKRIVVATTPGSTVLSRCSPTGSGTSDRPSTTCWSTITETVFEQQVGGGIVDRAVDGSECRWARIPGL